MSIIIFILFDKGTARHGHVMITRGCVTCTNPKGVYGIANLINTWSRSWFCVWLWHVGLQVLNLCCGWLFWLSFLCLSSTGPRFVDNHIKFHNTISSQQQYWEHYLQRKIYKRYATVPNNQYKNWQHNNKLFEKYFNQFITIQYQFLSNLILIIG